MAVVDSLEFFKHISKIKNILMYRNVGMMVTPHLLPTSNKYCLFPICFWIFLPSFQTSQRRCTEPSPSSRPTPCPTPAPKSWLLAGTQLWGRGKPPHLCCTSEPRVRPAWVCSPASVLHFRPACPTCLGVQSTLKLTAQTSPLSRLMSAPGRGCVCVWGGEQCGPGG